MAKVLEQSNGISSKTNRRSANYHPSIWGHHFLSYDTHALESDDTLVEKVEQLKKEVKRRLMAPIEKPSHKLDLIDAIQRLGVSYHFEDEICVILKELHDQILKQENNYNDDDDDLYTVALRFRLFRQGGFNISCEFLEKYLKDSEGKFKESIVNDVRGMLSLYEATHLSIHGEEILDEALAFTITHLQEYSNLNLSTTLLASQVKHALDRPLRKGLPRLEAMHYFSIYQQEPSHSELLLTFAKYDFNLLQELHQRELSHISKWWKDLDVAKNLPFARDRIVECYFWILGVFFEPEYLFARRFLTKVIAVTSVMDDIYDVYGTLEELHLFTQAVERWDINSKDQLPEYLRSFFQALLDVFSEAEEYLATQGRSYRIYYAKEEMKRQARVYLEEATWYHEKHIPTLEEYMSVALISCGYPLLATISVVGMGDVATKDSFEWLSKHPNKIIKACSLISRLMDDIVSHKSEQERGDVVSAIECYMTKHGCTEEEAERELKEQVNDAWKDINEGLLNPTSIPMALLMPVLNLSRVMDVVYKDEDGYTNAHVTLKDSVSSLLINPVRL